MVDYYTQSPVVLSGKEIDKSVDIWAFLCIINYIYKGKYLFEYNTVALLYERIKSLQLHDLLEILKENIEIKVYNKVEEYANHLIKESKYINSSLLSNDIIQKKNYLSKIVNRELKVMKEFIYRYNSRLEGFPTYDELKTKLEELERVVVCNNKNASYNYNLLKSFRNNYYNDFLKKMHCEIHEYVKLDKPFSYECFNNCSLETNNPEVLDKCLNKKMYEDELRTKIDRFECVCRTFYVNENEKNIIIKYSKSVELIFQYVKCFLNQLNEINNTNEPMNHFDNMEDVSRYYLDLYNKLLRIRNDMKEQIEMKKNYLNNTYHANIVGQDIMSNIQERITSMQIYDNKTSKFADAVKLGRGILNDLEKFEKYLMNESIGQIQQNGSNILDQMKHVCDLLEPYWSDEIKNFSKYLGDGGNNDGMYQSIEKKILECYEEVKRIFESHKMIFNSYDNSITIPQHISKLTDMRDIWKVVVEKILKNDYDILIRICDKYEMFNDNLGRLKNYFTVMYIPMDEIGRIEDEMRCLIISLINRILEGRIRSLNIIENDLNNIQFNKLRDLYQHYINIKKNPYYQLIQKESFISSNILSLYHLYTKNKPVFISTDNIDGIIEYNNNLSNLRKTFKESIENVTNNNSQLADMNCDIIERLLELLSRDGYEKIKPLLFTIHFPIPSFQLKDDFIEFFESIDQKMSGDDIDLELSIDTLFNKIMEKCHNPVIENLLHLFNKYGGDYKKCFNLLFNVYYNNNPQLISEIEKLNNLCGMIEEDNKPLNDFLKKIIYVIIPKNENVIQSIKKFELDVKECIRKNDINEWKKELTKLRKHFSEDALIDLDYFIKAEIPNDKKLNVFLESWISQVKKSKEIIDDLPQEIEKYIPN